MANRRMIMSAFFFNPQGDHRMSWRHPGAPGKEIFGLDYFRRLAGAAEEAKMDAIFLADHVAIWDSYESNIAHYANTRLEPLTLLSALAAVTSNIGLISTASASYTEPYNLARTFASLDHISGGRSAWNVVTSGMNEEAMNFGRDGNIEHAYRYERAAEFLETAKALWDSIEEEALLFDKRSGFFADPARVHRINHVGKHFKVRGPLNVPRPPQGYPIIVQAGSSEDGKVLAAKHAEINFSLSRSIEEGKKYRADFDARLITNGRTPDSLKILPGILPIVAASASEAEEKRDFLESLTPPRLAVDLVSSWVGKDLSSFPADGPVPELPDEGTFNGQRTNLIRVKAMAAQGMTIRQIASQVAKAGTAPVMAGTPKQIADEMEAWFIEGAADGFNLMFPVLPGDWQDFTRDVAPELQRRGLVQREYAPGTLRDKLGLQRPANMFVSAR
ncbi:LLM class flavin-dependent oxidoreductase [Neorhizobium sp. Rsf11]|uniref:LLM class flavin-dependent oxidoreductase n=2 Tax=Neorhizobium TaxID=1525371 RepID=A0ABV0MBY7_9HYPH|nr:LLM class flavin-dependent oxidoreductase [Neorhizobium petrolearium]MCC2613727.1 LLM class flavin-dependent oxidoreductase [Neorhizobium petrolearium]WGI72039.1 LLM class flavin-dependent oxidoreductase [Neorhizobium petrolearium]